MGGDDDWGRGGCPTLKCFLCKMLIVLANRCKRINGSHGVMMQGKNVKMQVIFFFSLFLFFVF